MGGTARGPRPDTRIVIRKRTRAALISLRKASLARNEGVISGLKGRVRV
jgi:hypothetical protein